MKDELKETNAKLDEVKILLNELYAKESKNDEALIDMFKPLIGNMLKVIAERVENESKRILYQRLCGELMDDPNDVEQLQELIKLSALDIKGFIRALNTDLIINQSQEDIDGNSDWLKNIQNLINQNQFLQAVKLYKDATGLGLKESKDACDKMRKLI